MKYIKTLTVAFFFFLLNQAGAFAQITVLLQQPPPYQFKVEHIWKVTLVNSTQTTYRVYLRGMATEMKYGRIVAATTTTFMLPLGLKTVNARELAPLNVKELKSRYSGVVTNIDGVTAGDYEIRVSVIDTVAGRVSGFQCMPTEVQNLGQVKLLKPANGAKYSPRAEPKVCTQPALFKVL